MICLFVFFKQKTAYEVRISDWSSDVCSSDLIGRAAENLKHGGELFGRGRVGRAAGSARSIAVLDITEPRQQARIYVDPHRIDRIAGLDDQLRLVRSVRPPHLVHRHPDVHAVPALPVSPAVPYGRVSVGEK